MAAPTAAVGDELSTQRQLLAFIAGFVAHKCRDVDRSLGEPSSTAKPDPSVPVGWLQLLSRGGLLVPSEKWLGTVLAFEVIFCAKMGTTASQQRGIMAELVEAILKKNKSIDRKVAWTLARTRVWIRIRWLNRRLTEEAAERLARQQVIQHSRSHR